MPPCSITAGIHKGWDQCILQCGCWAVKTCQWIITNGRTVNNAVIDDWWTVTIDLKCIELAVRHSRVGIWIKLKKAHHTSKKAHQKPTYQALSYHKVMQCNPTTYDTPLLTTVSNLSTNLAQLCILLQMYLCKWTTWPTLTLCEKQYDGIHHHDDSTASVSCMYCKPSIWLLYPINCYIRLLES